MKKILTSFVVPVMVLAVFGAGCSRTKGSATLPTSDARRATSVPSNGSSGVAFILLNGGSANVVRANESAKAADNAWVDAGDRVVVTGGTVSLIYPRSGESRLDSGTDVTIVSDASSSGLFAELRLAAGRVWTRFERVFGSDEHFSVAANGVVATVRGTAFGVMVQGQSVDVRVADHQVEVSKETGVGESRDAAAAVAVNVGQDVFVSAGSLSPGNIDATRKLVRTLSENEKKDAGYEFGSTKIAPERLQQPAASVTLFSSAPTLPSNLDQRLQELKQEESTKAGFAAPSRGVTSGDIAPKTVEPGVTGPGR